MAFDLLVRGGTLVDGSGAPAFRGDVAISDGRIAELGRVSGTARRVIEADGLAVAPGFVDVHTHYDAQVCWDPLCSPSPSHGVTTVVMGNCGYALAPVRPADRDYVMGLFSCVEQVAKSTLRAGVPFAWETQPEYLQWLERRGLGINVAAQVGHSALRRYALGERAHQEEASPEEVETMRRLVRDGLRAGAVGFTTSRVAHQKGEQGEPIPSFVAAESEIFALADVLREEDRGIIGINPRTKILDFGHEDREQLRKLARATGRMVNWNEFNHRWEYPDQWRSLLDWMEGAQREGDRIYAVMRCQRMDLHFNLRGGRFFEPAPAWRELVAAPLQEKRHRASDPASRAALLAGFEDHARKQGAVGAHPLPWVERLLVAVPARERNRGLAGRRLVELAASRGAAPAEVLLDLAADEDFETELGFEGVMNGDEEAVAEMLASPATLTGISDAGAHLHSFCGVDFPTWLLSHWVREKGVLSLERAVRSLTSEPATLLGLADRGVLAPGAAADLCLFDPARVAPAALEVLHDLPGGESRQSKGAVGVEWVLVNGEVLFEAGEASGVLPGRVLGAQPAAASAGRRPA